MATIALDDPDTRNALGNQTLDELILALEAARDDGAVRCVVLTSTHEKVFSAGGNLDGFAADVPLVHKHFGIERFPRLFRLMGELGRARLVDRPARGRLRVPDHAGARRVALRGSHHRGSRAVAPRMTTRSPACSRRRWCVRASSARSCRPPDPCSNATRPWSGPVGASAPLSFLTLVQPRSPTTRCSRRRSIRATARCSATSPGRGHPQYRPSAPARYRCRRSESRRRRSRPPRPGC